jgi:hypothetical protein
MSEVWKAFGLRDRACKGSNIITATSSRREASRRLHGVFREEKVVNGSNWLKNHVSRLSNRKIRFVQTTSWSDLQVKIELINGLVRIVNGHS